MIHLPMCMCITYIKVERDYLYINPFSSFPIFVRGGWDSVEMKTKKENPKKFKQIVFWVLCLDYAMEGKQAIVNVYVDEW